MHRLFKNAQTPREAWQLKMKTPLYIKRGICLPVCVSFANLLNCSSDELHTGCIAGGKKVAYCVEFGAVQTRDTFNNKVEQRLMCSETLKTKTQVFGVNTPAHIQTEDTENKNYLRAQYNRSILL